MTIMLGGFSTNDDISDTAIVAPFGTVSVSDSLYAQVSATIAFAAANGTLSGSGLSADVVSGGTVTYSLSAATVAALQGELQALAFMPIQGADGATVTTIFDLTVADAETMVSDDSTTVAATSPITLGGFTTSGPISDKATIDPFSTVTVSDSIPYDQPSATISFAAANGTLSGPGLSAAAVSGGTVTYSISATAATALQAELQALTFTPTANQGADGATVTTAFDLTVTDVNAWPTTTSSATLSSGISEPESVATDAAGDVFVASYGNNTVEEFSSAGLLVRTLSSGINQPYSVATDAAGDVYVANFDANAVEEFSPAGLLVQTLSSGVDLPFSVATDAVGDVFVANEANSTVEKFSSAGALLWTLSSGSNGPFTIATDAAGDVFVANYLSSAVEEFSPAGALLRTLSSAIEPVSVATDAAGDVFVAAYGNDAVEKFSSAGALEQTLSNGISTPHTVTTDAAGDVFVASTDDSVEEFSSAGALLRTLSSGISLPQGVATDADGDLFVANFGANTVEEFAPIGVTTVSDDSTTVAVTETSPITLGGFTTNGAISDTETIAPFSAVTVSDSIPYDQVSATIAFAAANGALSGAGLSEVGVSNGSVTYSLAATDSVTLQAELQALIFTPIADQAAPGSTVTTGFDLTVADATASVSDSSTAVTVTEAGAPAGYYYDPTLMAYFEDPAGSYSAAGATSPTIDLAGTYSGAGAAVATLDPAGTFSGPGAAAATTDPAGTFSDPGAPSATQDPAGTYSGAGAAVATQDPAGTFSGPGAAAATTDPAGTFSDPGAPSATQDPAGTFSGPGAVVATTDPAGTYSGAGAAVATQDPAGTFSGSGSAVAVQDPAGTFSGAGAAVVTLDPAGTFSGPGAPSATQDPAGTYSAAGAASATPDPDGTYSGPGASAPIPSGIVLTVVDTDIGSAAASAVPFTVIGIEPGDTGVVTFTDADNNTATANVAAGQTSYTVDLSGLADGPITSSLQVAPDAAGNVFAPVLGTVVSLDTATPAVAISSTGGETNAASQTISGTVTESNESEVVGTTVTLYGNGSMTALGSATVQPDGSWSAPVTLSDGPNSIVAEDTDLAGNVGTGGPVSYTYSPDFLVVTFLGEQPALDALPYGFSISDTAANVAMSFDQLNGDGHINSIVLTDGGVPTLTLSVEQALNDTLALSEITSPYVTALADTAADIEAITSMQVGTLQTDGYTSIAATTGPVALTIAEATILSGDGIALTGAPVIVSGAATAMAVLAPSEASTLFGVGYILAVDDTAAHIQGLTITEIAALEALHVTQISASNASVALTVAQAKALETGGIAVSAPSGDTVTISDTAAHLEGLTASQIDGLTAIGATGLISTNASVALTVAQVEALETGGIAVSAPSGDTVMISHTAAHLAALTANEISGLPAIGVTGLISDNASLALTVAQAEALETAGIAVSAPSGDTVTISDTAARLEGLTASEIGGLTAIGVAGLVSTNANVSYSSTQSAALVSNALSVSASGSYTATEHFADGGYSIFQSGQLVQQKSVNPDGSYDVAHFDVTGLGYTSYEDIYNAAATPAAAAQDMTVGSGNLVLYANGLTMTSSSGSESVATGSDTFAINPHTTETVTATGRKNETFVFGAGFGQDALAGFLATGNHDLLQFSASMFGFMTPASQSQQTADAHALLNNSSFVSGTTNTVITDQSGDTLTLNGVALTTLKAHLADFKFT
jgi:hypothetical protein